MKRTVRPLGSVFVLMTLSVSMDRAVAQGLANPIGTRAQGRWQGTDPLEVTS